MDYEAYNSFDKDCERGEMERDNEVTEMKNDEDNVNKEIYGLSGREEVEALKSVCKEFNFILQ